MAAGSPANGLYVVSRGIVVKMSPNIAIKESGKLLSTNTRLKLLQTLKQGDWFGERSLYIENEVYLLSYQSRSFCEMLYLSTGSFKRQCQLHLTKLERESLEKYLSELEMLHQPSNNHAEDEDEDKDEDEDSNDKQGDVQSGVYQLVTQNQEKLLTIDEITSHDKKIKLETNLEIGKPAVQIGESGLDSDTTDSTGGPFISRKQRRVALQLGNSFKLEESNYLTILFHPETKIMMFWRSLVACAVLYYMFSAPLLLSVSLDDHIIQQNLTVFVLSYICDGIMVIHLIMSMFFFPFLQEGVLISRSEEIFQHYQENHYISMDILALVPLDLLGIGFGAKIIPALRLTKLYPVLQTSRYLRELKGFSEAIEKGELATLVWWLYMLIHWYGCLWVLAARIGTRVDILHFLLLTPCRFLATK